MKDYVLDANAVLRYFSIGDGEGGEKVLGLFEQAERGHAELSMSVINLGEVFYILLKRVGVAPMWVVNIAVVVWGAGLAALAWVMLRLRKVLALLN